MVRIVGEHSVSVPEKSFSFARPSLNKGPLGGEGAVRQAARPWRIERGSPGTVLLFGLLAYLNALCQSSQGALDPVRDLPLLMLVEAFGYGSLRA